MISLLLLPFLVTVSAFAPTATTVRKIRTTPRVLSSASSSVLLDDGGGIVKSVTRPGNGELLRLGDIATVKYSCYLPGEPPFAKSMAQKTIVGDSGMIEGWDKALKTMRVGERSVVRIERPEWGYGANGVPPLIPPNAILEMDLEILDAQAATTNIDFDSLAMADKTPRTATDIAAAFEVRKAAKATEPVLEGLDAFIEKVKNFYFFGLFEGETGERPPWFLRPSITFPIAFVVVGVTFYIAFAGGAIYERGAQVKDELDEFIISSVVSSSPSAVVAALALFVTCGQGDMNLP